MVKAVPSRVGAGPLPFEIPEAEQDRRGIVEYGVTTGRRRRKARRISRRHLEEAVMLNGPTQIALTFCDHLDPVWYFCITDIYYTNVQLSRDGKTPVRGW